MADWLSSSSSSSSAKLIFLDGVNEVGGNKILPTDEDDASSVNSASTGRLYR